MKNLILLLIFIVSYTLYSESIFPFEIESYDNLTGTNILNSSYDSQMFQFKIDISNDNLTIKKIDKNTIVKSAILNNIVGLDYINTKNNIYILVNNFEFIKILIFDNNLNLINDIKIAKLITNINLDNIKFEGQNNNSIFLRIGNQILEYSIQNGSISNFFNLNTNEFYFYDNYHFILKESNKIGNLTIYDQFRNQILDINITIFDNIKILNFDENCFVVVSPNNNTETLVQRINIKTKSLEQFFWIHSYFNINDITKVNNRFLLSYLDSYDNKLYLKDITSTNNIKTIFKENIDKNLIKPLFLSFSNQNLFILFNHRLIRYDLKGNIQSSDIINISNEPSKLIFNQNINLLSIKFNNSSLLVNYTENNMMMINRFWLIFKTFGIIILLLLIILILYLLYKRKKRLFNEILQHPALGIIYYVDNKTKLKLTNNLGEQSLRLNKNIPRGRHFSFYCKDELNLKISEILERTLNSKNNIKEIIIINEKSVVKDWIINTFIIRNIAGIIRGVMISANDITEQLERQRLVNLAQFAHDMQTNLSTIRLNTEQIPTENNSDNLTRKNKILFQVNILNQRVRDLLAVGRDDILEIEEINSIDIINSVYSEFDQNIYPDVIFTKEIEISRIYCDKQKLVRGIRNAVENSLKYLINKKGTIIIKISGDAEYYKISIIDDGIGMDDEIKSKMLQPYFTTKKKSGGSGIGTIIMQKVAELHFGKIEIYSEPSVGTQLIFVLPVKLLKNYKNKSKNE